MSLAECTATSMRPSSNASSSSFTKTPRAPISPNGRVRSRSPAVVIGTSASSTPGPRSRAAERSACVRASLLPREPTRISTAPGALRDRLAALGLAPAAGQRLGHDRLEIVDVVEVAAVELVDPRVEIARNREIDEEERPPLPSGQCALDVLPRQDPAGRAGRGEEDVRARESRVQLLESKGGGAEAAGELLCTFGRTVRNEGDRRPSRDQVPNGQLSHLAGADNTDRATAQVAEDLFGECGGGGRDGSRTLPDRGLRPRLAPCMERLAEEPVEQRPGCSHVVRHAYLAEDLALARHHRIEAGRNAEEMQSRRLVAKTVERGPEVFLQRQQRGLGLLFRLLGGLVREVELRPVARREADRLGLRSRELLCELAGAARLERRTFSELDGRPVVRDADKDDAHVAKWVTGRASRTTATSTNPASTRYAARRPRHPARWRRAR